MSTGFGRSTLTLGSVVRNTITSSSQNFALPNAGKEKLYLISVTAACYLNWGNGSQTASTSAFDLFLPAGAVIAVDLASQPPGTNINNVAVIRDSADGVVVFHEILAR